jgi:pyruvate-formate lyase
MATVLKKEASMLDRVVSMAPTEKFEEFREKCMGAEPVVKIDHARIYTRVMRETDGQPMVIRRAKAFSAVVREMPISIDGHIQGRYPFRSQGAATRELLPSGFPT